MKLKKIILFFGDYPILQYYLIFDLKNIVSSIVSSEIITII